MTDKITPISPAFLKGVIWKKTMNLRVQRRQKYFASGENGGEVDSYRWEKILQQEQISDIGETRWVDVEQC